MTRLRGWALVLATVGVAVALDQMTKAWALSAVAPGEHRNIFFGVELVRVHNSGVAFGALSGSGALVIGAVVIALAGLLLYFAAHADTPGLWLPVGVVFGGALGNLADRARMGAVIDFIDPMLWPAFNLADVMIVFGVLGVLYVAEKKPS
jgi:signal peptidase II